MKQRIVSYDWIVEGQEAVFTVDTSLFERAPDSKRPVLIYISVFGQNDMAPISQKELKRSDKLITKLLRFADLVYAGQIDTEYARQYYFYAPSADMLGEVEDFMLRYKKLSVACGAAREEFWQSYLKLLYPTAAKWQTVENERTIALMASKGDNTAAVRKISFFCFFYTEPVVALFTEEARLSGFAVGSTQFMPEQSRSYGITLHRLSSLKKRELDSLTTALMHIIEKYDGVLSHTDCQFIPGKSPLA